VNISIRQAIDLWVALEACRAGTNSHGGDTAEIYAYRLMPYSPSYTGRADSAIFAEDHAKMEVDAGRALRELLVLFVKTYRHEGLVVEMGVTGQGKGIPLDDWNPRGDVRFVHRIHVRVTRTKDAG